MYFPTAATFILQPLSVCSHYWSQPFLVCSHFRSAATIGRSHYRSAATIGRSHFRSAATNGRSHYRSAATIGRSHFWSAATFGLQPLSVAATICPQPLSVVSSLYQLGLQLIVQPCISLEPAWGDMGRNEDRRALTTVSLFGYYHNVWWVFTRSPKLPIKSRLLPEDSVCRTRHFKEPVRPIVYMFGTVLPIPICLHRGPTSQLFA
jgi:hypothetical protein